MAMTRDEIRRYKKRSAAASPAAMRPTSSVASSRGETSAGAANELIKPSAKKPSLRRYYGPAPAADLPESPTNPRRDRRRTHPRRFGRGTSVTKRHPSRHKGWQRIDGMVRSLAILGRPGALALSVVAHVGAIAAGGHAYGAADSQSVAPT